MRVSELLTRLRQQRIEVSVDGDRLRVRGRPEALSPELRATLAQRKAEIIAALREASRSSRLPALEPVDREGELPLSFGQQQLWFLDQMDAGAAYNLPWALRLAGHVDPSSLEKAFAALMVRHEILRTTFPAAGGRPRQVIAPSVAFELRRTDLRALPEVQRERELQRLVNAEARERFDLQRGPLLRALLLELTDEESALVVVAHHIVTDGISCSVMMRDLAALYAGEVTGRAPSLPDLPVQYADFAAWQRRCLSGEYLEGQLAYWRERLGGELSMLRLPTDRTRGVELSFRGAHESLLLPRELLARIEAHGTADATPFITLLTAFKLMLRRCTGQDDVIVGSTVMGRRRTEIEPLIGPFVNMLALRTAFPGDPSLREALHRVRDTFLDALAHEDIPFDRVVDEIEPERDGRTNPIFQVVFNFLRPPNQDTTFGPLVASPLELGVETSRFDLEAHLFDAEDGLRVQFIYNRDLFERPTIRRMLDDYHRLLDSIAADLGTRLSELPLLTEEEHQQIVHAWNATARDYPRESVARVFEEVTHRHGDRCAVALGDEALSYRALDRRANQVANYLRGHGVVDGTLVGVYLERGVDLIAAILGILKAGGAYVPLDTSYPQERLAFMLEDTSTPVLVSSLPLREGLPRYGGRIVLLDEQRGAIAEQPGTVPANQCDADSLAYVMYTSGSTGRPKGVMVPHRGITRLVFGVDYATFDETCVTLQLAPTSFDASTMEIWGPLLHGGKVALYPDAIPTTPVLREEIARHEVTTLWLTASLYNMIISEAPETLAGVKELLTGGEALSVPHIRRGLEQLPDTQLINGYGPTESTTFTCCWRIPRDLPHDVASVALGPPIGNTRVYVLDRRGHPVPVGVVGELFIGGDGLAWGYHRRPALTAERFVPDPFGGRPGATLYRTGDLARWNREGMVEFVGRDDGQVKIRGFRIEITEIEHALVRLPSVREAVVLARQDEPGDKKLAAYIVLEEDEASDPDQIRAGLEATLPSYMVPAAFVVLEALPLSPNGKVDHGALPVPDASDQRRNFVEPQTESQRLLCEIWSRVLGVERVGLHDNFFALGGDSIQVIQVVSAAREAAGATLRPKELFQHPTPAELAKLLEARAAAGAPSDALDDGTAHGESGLVPIQRWFFEQRQPNPWHFNQAVMLRLRADVAGPELEQVIAAVVAHHDALRSRFCRNDSGWVQHAEAHSGPPFEEVDLSDLPNDERAATVHRHADAVQASLDPEQGRVFRVVRFRLCSEEPPRLLLVAHHLVIDGVSWRVLLADLERGLQQLRDGTPVALPPPTTSVRRWSRRLKAYAAKPELQESAGYWLSRRWGKVRNLPVDRPTADRRYGSMAAVTRHLTPAETQSLLTKRPQSNPETTDVLLAALASALAEWTGSGCVAVNLEGHGREDLFPDIDLSRTVGWFTTIYPLVLDLRGVDEPDDLLDRVVDQRRAVPNRGLDFGVARYLCDDATLSAKLVGLPVPQVSFNYLGQFGELGERPFWTGLAPESSGRLYSDVNHRPHSLDVLGTIADGRLGLRWEFSSGLHDRSTIERVASHCMRTLRELITTLCSSG